MPIISSHKFLLWKEKQILKGGDYYSLSLLIDSLGGLSRKQINSLTLSEKKKVNLKISLESLESVWDEHLLTSAPIQHLSGITYWRDLKLEVSNKVLIPRPETEIMIEIVSELFKNNQGKKIFADLGTGSGALSIALALANPIWEGIATDVDKNVLDIASRNFANCSKQSNLSFYCGHWWNPLNNFKGKIDLAVANPPYIPKDVYAELPLEVKNFEPKIALFGGEDGLDHIKEIIKFAPLFLREKGWLLLENHYDQGDKVKELFHKKGFVGVRTLRDFSGIGRFTIGRYK